MKVRVSFVVEVPDSIRREINAWYGRPGLANRDEIKDWYMANGTSTDDDLSEMASRNDENTAWLERQDPEEVSR